MLFPFGPHRLYPSFVASVSLLLISMLVPKAGGAKGPALRLRARDSRSAVGATVTPKRGPPTCLRQVSRTLCLFL